MITHPHHQNQAQQLILPISSTSSRQSSTDKNYLQFSLLIFKRYTPNHPISFLVENIVQRGASLLLRAFTYKILPREELADVHSRFKTSVTKLVRKYITELNSNIYENTLAGAIKHRNRTLALKIEQEYNLA